VFQTAVEILGVLANDDDVDPLETGLDAGK